jgi:alcohol dehydrogenase (cytochrome c)
VASWENAATTAVAGQFPRAASANARQTAMGQANLAPFFNDDTEPFGVVRAYDAQTLDRKWEFRMSDITWGGTFATASDLVFSGGRDGYFLALDGRTGALLWKASVGGQINAGAMSYSVNGRQYVAIAAGNALFAYALPQ